ncbi:probable LRR receptor-like serine/threonine-protein kinase At5g63710 [Rutidosis leptorrhynchoides]|uniref:probable LRR receptor-like serine/threonine-protein kinase At5g63710 n=1 Tax=Rutidosis leptorrhynchoides TaxID=125765 RepID=UPI003A9987F9
MHAIHLRNEDYTPPLLCEKLKEDETSHLLFFAAQASMLISGNVWLVFPSFQEVNCKSSCNKSLSVVSNNIMFRAFSGKSFLRLITTCLVLVVSLRTSSSSSGPDVEGEALIEFRKALNDSNNQIADWNYFLVSPCSSWSQVTCNGDGNVVTLSLGSKGFSGTLSPSITKLKFLVHLELQDNNLSGSLPEYLGELVHLEYLNLANNRFSGSMPSNWAQLTNLKQLDLSSNNLSGRIPEQLFSVSTFNFSGTSLTCGSGIRQPCAKSSLHPAESSKSKFWVVMASASFGAFLLLSFGVIFAYRCLHLRKLKHEVFVDVPGEDDQNISLGQIKRFSLRQIEVATDNFSETNVIGQGGFGKVYRGILPDNTKVAVKRLADHHSPGGEAAFQREVQLISVAVHKNLLRLIGFCTTSSERILVYPFMQNLSVAYRLRDLKPGEKGLDWATRKRVAYGAANGLEYLHEYCNPKIIHRDLKAANILLDEHFEAVLGDFGLAKLVDTKLTHVTTQIRGTMGHIAPEYLSTGKSSEKTDVFGYGVTLLELVTGQRAIDFARLEEEEDVLLLDHIKKLLRENRLQDIVDGNLKTYDASEVETVLQVALLCTQSSPEDRPTMASVVRMLQGVGLAERWAEWEQFEHVRNQELSRTPRPFDWANELSFDQEAIELSRAR